MNKLDLQDCKKTDAKWVLFAFAFVLLCAFQGKTPEPKTYPLSLTVDEWQKYTSGIQYTLSRIRQSDLPSKEVSLMTDSVLIPLFTAIQSQIGGQLQEEEVARKAAEKKKADSTNRKKN